MKKKQSVEQYVASYPVATQTALKRIRQLVKENAPGEITEVISYGIPTVKIAGKNVMHYGAFRDHVSLYPASDEMIRQIPALSSHRTGKGTIQFSLNEPIDYELVAKTIKYLLVKI